MSPRKCIFYLWRNLVRGFVSWLQLRSGQWIAGREEQNGGLLAYEGDFFSVYIRSVDEMVCNFIYNFLFS